MTFYILSQLPYQCCIYCGDGGEIGEKKKKSNMEILNRIKGGVSSLIGLIGLVGIIAHITGFYEFPNPEFMNDWWESGIGLIVCVGFFYLKDSEISDFIRQAWSVLISLFKKKAE